MKKIGNADNGNILLECSLKEYETLQSLEQVVRGAEFPLFPYRDTMNESLEAPFAAIREWILVKERANSLRRMADAIDHAIGERMNEIVRK